MSWDPDWPAHARCRELDPDTQFVWGAEQTAAKRLCIHCEVRTECLAEALDRRIEHGIWGGLTERQRRIVLRRRPSVTSWRALLEAARDEYDRRPARI